MRTIVLALAIAGCAPTYRDLRAPVDIEVGRRLGASLDPRVQINIDALLAKPLDHTAATQIALANSPRLAAALDELGIAGGGLAAALGLGATEVDLEVRFGATHEIELHVVQSVLGLITGARRGAAARADIAVAQATATATALRLIARVEIGFTDLLAAQQEVELRQTAFDAASAAATVRERMHAAGNTSDLAQARDRDAREQARIELARAEATVETRREAVNALLGLTGAQTKWTAVGRVRELPPVAPALDKLESKAVAESLELAAGRARVTGAANHAGDVRLRALLPELGLGVSYTDDDNGNSIGPMIRIGLPLLDWRSGDRMRANAAERRAEHELTAVAVELRAAARAARVTALATYAEAHHLQLVVLPLRQQIVDETLRHYNAMDADPFTLIVARRELVDAGHQLVDATRRYWDAMAEVTALEAGVTIDPPASRAELASPTTRPPEH